MQRVSLLLILLSSSLSPTPKQERLFLVLLLFPSITITIVLPPRPSGLSTCGLSTLSWWTGGSGDCLASRGGLGRDALPVMSPCEEVGGVSMVTRMSCPSLVRGRGREFPSWQRLTSRMCFLRVLSVLLMPELGAVRCDESVLRCRKHKASTTRSLRVLWVCQFDGGARRPIGFFASLNNQAKQQVMHHKAWELGLCRVWYSVCARLCLCLYQGDHVVCSCLCSFLTFRVSRGRPSSLHARCVRSCLSRDPAESPPPSCPWLCVYTALCVQSPVRTEPGDRIQFWFGSPFNFIILSVMLTSVQTLSAVWIFAWIFPIRQKASVSHLHHR